MPTIHWERFGSDARCVGGGIAGGGDFWADRSAWDGASYDEVYDRSGEAVLFAVFFAAVPDGSSMHDARNVGECDVGGARLARWGECWSWRGGASCLMRGCRGRRFFWIATELFRKTSGT